MQKIRRQGGSVAVFVVVGIVLVLAAMGALYGVKHIASRDQTPPMTVPGESADEAEQGGAEIQGGKDAPADEAEPGTGQTESPAGQDSTNRDQSSDSTPRNDASNKQPSGSAEKDKSLPQSGPEDVLAGAFAMSAIAVSATAYIRSLRRL